MTLPALLACIVLGGGSLIWGYVAIGLDGLARWIAVLASVWLFAVWQRWRWFAYVGLAGYFLAAALGLWFLDFPPGWMFAGAIFGLMAWDLTAFRHRLAYAADNAERHLVESRHMLALSVIAILGFILSSLAMLVKATFSFEWAVFLVLVLCISLAMVFRWFSSRG